MLLECNIGSKQWQEVYVVRGATQDYKESFMPYQKLGVYPTGLKDLYLVVFFFNVFVFVNKTFKQKQKHNYHLYLVMEQMKDGFRYQRAGNKYIGGEGGLAVVI